MLFDGGKVSELVFNNLLNSPRDKCIDLDKFCLQSECLPPVVATTPEHTSKFLRVVQLRPTKSQSGGF